MRITILAVVVLCLVVQCNALRATHDYGNGIQVRTQNGRGVTGITFDGGNTWITTQTPFDYGNHTLDKKDRHTLNNSAAEAIACYDSYASCGFSCSNKIYVVKNGSAIKLDSGKRKGCLVNLKPKGKTLDTIGTLSKDYVKYIYFEKAPKDKLASLLDVIERYYKTDQFKHSFDITSQGEYGVYEIKYPIEVMKFTYDPSAEEYYNQYRLSRSNVQKLKRGYLIDAGTLAGMLDCIREGRLDLPTTSTSSEY